jgi:hypothetical protein
MSDPSHGWSQTKPESTSRPLTDFTRKDKMTPPERVGGIMAGKPVDRVPFKPFALGFCAKVAGSDDLFRASCPLTLLTRTLTQSHEPCSIMATTNNGEGAHR